MNPVPIRRIAVIVAGLDEEYQSSILQGIIEAARIGNANVACFAAFGGVLSNSLYDVGEYNIYNLINFKRFDGAILLTNTICDPEVRKKVLERVRQSGLSAVILDSDFCPEFYDICIDNRMAMREIISHVIEVHGAKTIDFISGPLANPEAKERYDTFLSVMAEHGLTVDEDRIYYGEFRPIDGKHAVESLLDRNLPLPDAIISANDAMAIEAIAELEERGIHVPQDVIVTGFDNTYYAQHHCPPVSTVARPLRSAGFAACERLLHIISGEPCDKTIRLAAEPVFRESCGCTPAEAEDLENYKRETYSVIKNTRSGISLLNRMTSSLSETDSIEEYLHVLSQFIDEIGCEQFCICINSDWQDHLHDTGSSLSPEKFRVEGYTEKMTAPLVWSKNKISRINTFWAADMFPMPFDCGGNVSYFLPLHFREHCLGYYIISNSDFPYRSMLCHSMMMSISHSLENIRKLLRLNNAIHELDRLYVIDPLCGIYNRNGFIRLADEMFRKCAATGDTLMISFIDMDGLKIINDQYGHDEGDFALRRLASAIRDSCSEDCICARFGGDEFISVGIDQTEDDAQHFETVLKKRLGSLNAILRKPYEFSASIGTLLTHVSSDMNLFTLISQADQMMYEQKKRKRTSRFLRQE